MTSGLKTILYPVKDLSVARELYGRLFGTPYVDESYYVGWGVDGQDVGLDPNGFAKGMTGPVGYWHVDDIEAALAALLAAGADAAQPVTNVGGGKLVATVTDSDGNVIGLLQPPA